MQHTLRPYATAGIALVGASMIAVTPLAAPLPEVQMRPVKLVDAWSDLIADTTTNLQLIADNSDPTAISSLFSELGTNPVGVIDALFNLTPTVDASIGTLPATVNIELPPGLELALANLGSTATTFSAISDVAGQLLTNPYESIATILNGYLNGTETISLLDGAITFGGFNGILAPLQDVGITLNLPDLVNALGLGGLDLDSLDLTNLFNQLGLNDLTVGSLFTDLGLSSDKLGDLLAHVTNPVTDLGGLLNLLGLDGLDAGQLSLTSLLNGLGLDADVDLNNLSLDQVLGAFGINSPLSDISGLSLSSILSSFGVDLPSGATLGATTLTGLLTDLNLNTLGLGTLLQDAVSSGVLGPTLGPLINTLLSTSENLLNQVNLGELLSGLTLGNGGSLSLDALLGDLGITLPGSTELANLDIGDVLASLGVTLPGNLSIGGILGDLGFSPLTGDLSLGQLLGDLGNPILGLPITDLLNGLNVGDLLGDLGLNNLPIDLSGLDLSTLNLGDLLSDVGLGDLASINIDGVGGLATLLADVIPQQILASLGM